MRSSSGSPVAASVIEAPSTSASSTVSSSASPRAISSRDSSTERLWVDGSVQPLVGQLRGAGVQVRSTLELLTSFGDGGRGPGQFFGIHNLATDSRGNIYTAETYTGARVQRFLFKGVGPVTRVDQGVVWPKGR